MDFYRPDKVVHTPPELTFYSQSFGKRRLKTCTDGIFQEKYCEINSISFVIAGVTRNHTDYFLKCRAPCINEAAVKTNNLIIRLDKLINQCPSDLSKRKGKRLFFRIESSMINVDVCSVLLQLSVYVLFVYQFFFI